ncbi:alpha/beta hydrolase [Vineibacter terrae]|uniref:alpha/beta hydrolase n=1 Tax=Vineibacter terrae TaxID=2586908 RepID=UPI002E2F0065|nr:alpha/beta hydrolase [Vineibacter terrae]HEX2888962.1 alpha/beta hydrolase [Vineibacter terrae]
MTNEPLTDDEHELHYNPQRAVPHFKDYQAERAASNGAARAQKTATLDVAYGAHALHKLDIFPAAASAGAAPVHVFLHGGYWRAQDKENFAFVAGTLVALGITTVIVNYELCPAATLDGVAASAIAAVDWTRREIARFGGDPARITISGHSAGAHLGAEVLAVDWRAQGIDPGFIRGAVLISGIFDPAPAIRTTVNAELNLTPALAARHNVAQRAPTLACPITILAGGREPWRWIDQSFAYSHHLRRHSLDPAVEVLPGYNHFDIMNQYLQPDSAIVRAIRAQALDGP